MIIAGCKGFAGRFKLNSRVLVTIKQIVFSAYLLAFLGASSRVLAAAEDEVPAIDKRPQVGLGNLTDPSSLLPEIDERITQKDSIFSVSPLGGVLNKTSKAKQSLYEATGLQLGGALTHLFQAASDTIDGEDDTGTATTMDLVATWDLINKGKPSQGQVVFHLQSRWDYGTTGPEDMGAASVGSVIGTADTYSRYSQTFVVRNLYWRQGAPETGWVYRVGKITPDALLSSSAYLDSQTTFLPSGGTGPFAIALPDSGLGTVGAWYPSDRVALVGLVSDANGDRFDSGDIGEGDFFTAAELHVKVAPRTPKAPASKLSFWYSDGTEDGEASNAMLGPAGWGFYIMHQQELTADGRAVGILRYGKSFNEAAIYEEQAAAHFLLNEPHFFTRLKNDAVGVAFNWARVPDNDLRIEKHAELFYRFPLFPDMDMTLSYQYVIDPALTRDIDDSSVFSLRLRSVF
jgi:porin